MGHEVRFWASRTARRGLDRWPLAPWGSRTPRTPRRAHHPDTRVSPRLV